MSDDSSGTMLDKTFDPAAIEAKWYAHWEEHGLFRPPRPDAAPFTIVNPPPNVTGNLHIGHALDNTLQDIVIRRERLKGKDVLWVVGTDHAGIATQMVVERQLEERQDKRTNYTREEFVEKVWEWKHESGGQITRQLRRLGCSMDWSREQFTMSPEFTRAVTKVFVDLYNEGLIYRDKRLVNWDPKLRTAISDLEVETREVQGSFWHFRYPLADEVRLDSGADHIVVATTRPETMLADMAVAVHPDDERYRSVIGKDILQPITGRRLRIVADEHADPELGSGAVKITPGHDFNDFEVGKRAGFRPADMLNMFDAEAKVVQTTDGLIPEEFVGLDRFTARDRVVAMLAELGLLGETEDRTIATPFGDRSNEVIEPWLTDQWYVDAEKLAQAPIQAVRDGRIEIVPKSWEKTFFNWMENIQPWCVSRQLWWGHRIPAWYGPKRSDDGKSTNLSDLSVNKVFVYYDEGRLVEECRKYYGNDCRVLIASTWNDWVGRTFENLSVLLEGDESRAREVVLLRDPDVLDTWFSSALWPFATLGWPEDDPPRNGEVAARSADGGVEASPRVLAQEERSRPLHHQPAAGGPPPRSGEDLPAPSLLARHYPNDLLISGFDILFFWDARMAMQGMHFMGDVPWRRLYLHGLVRAPDGQKMSKSKGNVVDPLGLIERYGADALRLFMAAMESQGRDIKMDEKRVEGYRNFATKLWNAARFARANGIGASTSVAAPATTLAVNKWIIGEVVETLASLDKAMDELRFDAAAGAIYHFVWDRFCDWYVELVKPVLSRSSPSPDGEGDRSKSGGGVALAGKETPPPPAAVPLPGKAGEDETRAVAGWVLDQILVMLHPFMPFVTEELWSKMGARPYELILAKWPRPGAMVDAEAKAEVGRVIEFVSNVRSLRTEYNVPPGAVVAFYEVGAGASRAFDHLDSVAIRRMARVVQLHHELRSGGQNQQALADAAAIERRGVQFVIEGRTYALLLDEHIDVAAEQARLAKALAASQKERDSLAKRLANPAFIEKAKPEAVEKARADHAHHSAEAERLAAALARLG